MEFNIETLVRENIRLMAPYSSARHEFAGEASIFLDANENSIGSPIPPLRLERGLELAHRSISVGGGEALRPLNRYPDPLQTTLKQKLSEIKGLPPQNIFLGNGSDEAIDLLFRIFCEPKHDTAIIFPPTYGMYEVCAAMNDVRLKKIPLTEEYQLNMDAIEEAIDPHTKLIFICSPNNPTGNSIRRGDIEILLNNFDGLIVIDEAYINYARQRTFIPELSTYPNLVILQTLSKAWGLAGLRLGMAFAAGPVINYLNKVKYPYNINTATQQLALEALDNINTVNEWIITTVEQREWLTEQLLALPLTKIVYPSDANFVLVKMAGAKKIYDYLCTKGIIVRDRSRIILCDNCLRITIGTPEENKLIIKTLKTYEQ